MTKHITPPKPASKWKGALQPITLAPKPVPPRESWWLGVPADRFGTVAKAQAPRMLGKNLNTRKESQP